MVENPSADDAITNETFTFLRAAFGMMINHRLNFIDCNLLVWLVTIIGKCVDETLQTDRANRTRSSAKRGPSITCPASRCTFWSSSITSLKNITENRRIKMEPPRVLWEIWKGTQKPAELRTEPWISVYNAQRHLISIVGTPRRAIFKYKISRRTRGNAFRISTKHAYKCPFFCSALCNSQQGKQSLPTTTSIYKTTLLFRNLISHEWENTSS